MQTNFSEDESRKTFGELYHSEEVTEKNIRRTYLPFSAKYFFGHYSISGEHSDPSCSSQRNFTSFAVQTPVSQLSDN